LGSVRSWLSRPETHQTWVRTFYGAEALKFHELAIDYLLSVIHPKDDSLFLDAGCGDCTHSIQLATRGFSVQAVDISGPALDMARTAVKERNLGDRIKIESGDLTGLRFPDESFDIIVCWGVLMHIPPPGLESAIREMARVLRKGGILVISENNIGSLDSILHRNLTRLLRRGHTEVRVTPAGVEYWTRNPAGFSYVREDDLGWVIRQFGDQGLVVQQRVASMFTESWTLVRFPRLRVLILRFNRFWFRVVRTPHLAHGNLIIFRRPV
jgi:ubiquinone/menaquinone biosynthesis C-methylase UbiE